ncbi:MAG: homoserine kinase [Chloroflexi bacterium]|nr:homoserine kinase [Chloroflexota bacterium]
MKRLHVQVPATSANLGPGFDTLGVALGIYNDTVVETADRESLEVVGEGMADLQSGAPNLIHRAIEEMFRLCGVRRPPLVIRCCNAIPLGRGLGSSAAALVTGLLIGQALLENAVDSAALLPVAARLEGHGDNTSAALLGGFTVCVPTDDGIVAEALPAPLGLQCVLFIPDYQVSTELARRVLPERYRRADAVFNISRVALFVSALMTNRLDHLGEAMNDRLHQPYRLPLYRGMDSLIRAATDAGAYGASVSGAGPSMVAFADEGAAAGVAQTVAETVEAIGVAGSVVTVPIAVHGASVRVEAP